MVISILGVAFYNQVQILVGAYDNQVNLYKGTFLDGFMKVLTHKRKNLNQCLEEVESWNIEAKEKKSIKLFLNKYLSGEITSRIGSNPDGLVESLTNCLKNSSAHIKDNSKQVQIQNYFNDLLKDKIRKFSKKTKKYNGGKYSLRHKKEILSILRRYIAWKYPAKPKLLIPLNIKIKLKKKEEDWLELSEIDKLYKGAKNNKQRYIISSLFSTGARIEEFLNLRICDYKIPTDDNFIKVVIRADTSKTSGRTISLYYGKSFEAVTEYINERKRQGAKETDFILEDSYDSVRGFLTRLSKRILNKPIHPHLFRASCATWLASKLNRQQLCVFFSWSFSSNMPDIYIARKGVNMKEVDDKIKTDNFQEIQNQIEKEKHEKREMKEKIEQMEKENLDFYKRVEKMILIQRLVRKKKQELKGGKNER
ncbi:Tyrosine recombinase XerC [subsurface metagenome]